MEIKLFSAEKIVNIEGEKAELYINFYLILRRKNIFTFLINTPNLSMSNRNPVKLWKQFWMLYQEEFVKYLRKYERLSNRK